MQTGLLAWDHHGQLQELLVWLWEKFSPFPPYLYCLMHSRGSTCSETVLSSALHETDGNTISLGNTLCIFYFQ